MNRRLFGRKQTWGAKARRTGYLKYRPLIVEPLETRRFMSAFSPVQSAALETGAEMATLSDEMVSSSAIFAPQVPIAVSREENVSQGSAAADFGKQDVDQAASLNKADLETLRRLAVSGTEESELIAANAELGLVSGMTAETANTLAQDFPSIPPGDAGGLAGGNGGGRLPLEIPGFGGYGNAYYLTDLASMPRVVWLYAQYFGNQQRVVPETTELPRSDENLSAGSAGLFGTSLGTPFSYSYLSGSDKDDSGDESDEKKEESRNEKEEVPPIQERKIEHFIQEEMDRKFLDLLERKKFFEKQRSPMKYELQKPVFPEDVPIPEIWPGERKQDSQEFRPEPGIPGERNWGDESILPNDGDWIDRFFGNGVPLRKEEERITDSLFQSGSFGELGNAGELRNADDRTIPDAREGNGLLEVVTEDERADWSGRFQQSWENFLKKSDSTLSPSRENLERRPQDEVEMEQPSRSLNFSPSASPDIRRILPKPETDIENQSKN